MKREFNTPDEMVKRLIYVVYLACLFFGFGFAIMGTFGGQPHGAMLAAILIPLAIAFKYYGVRRFDFNRLGESFPLGSPADTISGEQRRRLEAMVSTFRDCASWSERQAIRLDIEEMVRIQPVLYSVFKQEIDEIHPALFKGATEKKD